MKITDGPIPDETMQKLRDCARGALEDLGPEVAAEGPAGIVAAIDEVMDHVQQNPGEVADEEGADPTIYFGALWGEQLVAALGWEWANVDAGNGATSIAVVSPDRSLVIHPFQFLAVCLRDPGLDVTVALAFNMLVDKTVPEMPPGGYADVMEGVRRIVPRR